MNDTDFAKIYTFDVIIQHLKEASKDGRKRERARANVALSNITKWYEKGLEVWRGQQ